jgi:DNA-binding IclR family transcriptional regulator
MGRRQHKAKTMDTTIVKGLNLLEMLALSEAPRGVSDLAREAKLTKSNVQRILSTLSALGYVRQEATGNRYQATLKAWEIGNRVLQRDRIVRAGSQTVKKLRLASGETAVLCMLDDMDVIYLDKQESENPVRLSCGIGARLPAYSTATGRVIVGFSPPEDRLRSVELARQDDCRAAFDLEERFQMICKRGFEISLGEYRLGVNSIAAPIRTANGRTIASVALTGPEERLTEQRMTDLCPMLLDAALSVSTALSP